MPQDYDPSEGSWKASSRGSRRHHVERLNQRSFDVFRHHRYQNGLPEAWRQARRLRDNMAFCARWCCANPRRRFKGEDRLGNQERREEAFLHCALVRSGEY